MKGKRPRIKKEQVSNNEPVFSTNELRQPKELLGKKKLKQIKKEHN